MAPALRRRIRALRKPVLVGYDCVMWLVALLVAAAAYSVAEPGAVSAAGLLLAFVAALSLQLLIATMVGQHHRQAPVGGRDDLVLQAAVTATAGAWAAIAHLLPGGAWPPVAVQLIATVAGRRLLVVGAHAVGGLARPLRRPAGRGWSRPAHPRRR